MRKMFMAILALAAVSSLGVPVRVFAQGDVMVYDLHGERPVSRAARLRTSRFHATSRPDRQSAGAAWS